MHRNQIILFDMIQFKTILFHNILLKNFVVHELF